MLRTPHHVRVTHANHFSCVARDHTVCVISEKSYNPRRISCRTLHAHPLPHSTPALFYPPNRSISCNPQQGVQFGRLAEQSPQAGHEPNDPEDVSSTGLTTMLLPLRKASIGSTYNSGEDIATSQSSSEVDERPTHRCQCRREKHKCSPNQDLSFQQRKC